MKTYFKEYINALWKESKLPQEAFAKKLGVGYSTLKDAITGRTYTPQDKFLKALAKYTKQKEIFVLKDIIYGDKSNNKKQNLDDVVMLYSTYLLNSNYKKRYYLRIYDYDLGYIFTDRRYYENHNRILISANYIFKNLNDFTIYDDEHTVWNQTIINFLLRGETLLIKKQYLSELKTIDIVFDKKNENSKKVFKLIDTSLFCFFNTNINFVLFDTKLGKVISTKEYKTN